MARRRSRCRLQHSIRLWVVFLTRHQVPVHLLFSPGRSRWLRRPISHGRRQSQPCQSRVNLKCLFARGKRFERVFLFHDSSWLVFERVRWPRIALNILPLTPQARLAHKSIGPCKISDHFGWHGDCLNPLRSRCRVPEGVHMNRYALISQIQKPPYQTAE